MYSICKISVRTTTITKKDYITKYPTIYIELDRMRWQRMRVRYVVECFMWNFI